MTIAKIIAPVRGDGKGEHVLSHAIALARVFDAHVEALHCRARSSDFMPFGVVVPRALKRQIEGSMADLAQSEEAHMRKLFSELAERESLEIVEDGTTPPRDRPTLGWREEAGRQADVLGVSGRLADLIVVPRPDHEMSLGFNTLYAAVMQTGRPVVMCPDRACMNGLPGHVALAWNGSMEAARAVAIGIDLLQRAERVTVLTVGDTAEGAAPERLVDYLALRGITAEVRRLPERRGVGAELLAGMQSAGADMGLMGAYSHSRGRETLLGGASQHVVDHAQLPVVLVH
mgnify:CR=1 FL=1